MGSRNRGPQPRGSICAPVLHRGPGPVARLSHAPQPGPPSPPGACRRRHGTGSLPSPHAGDVQARRCRGRRGPARDPAAAPAAQHRQFRRHWRANARIDLWPVRGCRRLPGQGGGNGVPGPRPTGVIPATARERRRRRPGRLGFRRRRRVRSHPQRAGAPTGADSPRTLSRRVRLRSLTTARPQPACAPGGRPGHPGDPSSRVSARGRAARRSAGTGPAARSCSALSS